MEANFLEERRPSCIGLARRARLGANGAISKSKRCANFRGNLPGRCPSRRRFCCRFMISNGHRPCRSGSYTRAAEKPTPSKLPRVREQFQIACGSFISRATRRTLFRYPWERSDCLRGCWRCGKAARLPTLPSRRRQRQAKFVCANSNSFIEPTPSRERPKFME